MNISPSPIRAIEPSAPKCGTILKVLVLALLLCATAAAQNTYYGTVGGVFNGYYVYLLSGGVLPYKNCVVASGSLPPGLTFSVVNQYCTVHGTPTVAGTYNVGLVATDNANVTFSSPYSLTLVIAPVINISTSLPNGRVGLSYSASVSLTGGTAPLTSYSTCCLPPGLTYSNGSITGTPTSAGTYSFGVSASDNWGGFTSRALSITITNALQISCVPSTGPIEVGVPYSAMCTAAGGSPPYGWSISSGALPGGLTLSPSAASASISGTPTTSGAYAYTVRVSDSNEQSVTQSYSGTVVPPPSVQTASLPNGTVGVGYSVPLVAVGGTGTYSWSLSSGGIPGLGLSNGGTLSGTPTTQGTYSITAQVTDGLGGKGTKGLSVIIAAPAPNIGCAPATGPVEVTIAYSANCTVAGGTGPFTWAISAGALPGGFSLTPGGSSATIAGTPSASGPYSYTVRVTDSAARSATQSFSGTVLTVPSVQTTSLPNGTVGVSYSTPLVAVGGTGTYSWSLSSGGIPGVSLNSGGTLGGTPTTTGTYSITAQVTDSLGGKGSKGLSLTIAAPALSMSCAPSSGPIEVTVAYSANCTVSGGAGPYSWSISAGALPAGVSITPSGATAAIAGAPTAAGAYSYTVKVADSASQSATQSYSGTVAAAPSIITGSASSGGVGTAFSQTFAAAGGTPPYIWSVTGGGVAGLNLSSAGVLSGTPSSAGTFSLTVRVSDTYNVAASNVFSVTIAPPGLTMSCSPSSGPTAAGANYSTLCTAVGGTPPYTWSTGGLPLGLKLQSASGANTTVDGALQVAGPYSFTVTVSDSKSQTASQTIGGTAAGALTISTTSLPAAATGVNYNQTLAAAGGAQPYTWSLSGGSLPQGLSLNTAGQITGTATASATSSFTVRVTDSAAANATRALVIIVAGGNTLTVSPGSLTFLARQDGSQPPGSQTVSVFATVSSAFTVNSGGTSWLKTTPAGGNTPGVVNVTVDATGLSPNDYTGSITITGTNTTPGSATVNVKLTVQASTGPQLSVIPGAINEAAVHNGGSFARQITVQNSGGGTLAYSAQATGGSWLALADPAGSVTAGSTAVIGVNLSPAGLAAGTYTGAVQVSGGGQNAVVNITLSVSAQTQTILLSQTGLEFTAVQNGPVPDPQDFGVLNTGTGPMSWTASAGTLSGGNAWLEASPSNGTSQGGSAVVPAMNVTVKPAGLAAGDYYGKVEIAAGGAANSPQQATIHLKVLPAGQAPKPQALPSGAIFTAGPGANATPKTISLTNLGAGAVSFTTTTSTEEGNWLSIDPAAGSVGSGGSTAVSLKADGTGLAAGIYRGALRVAFSEGTVREITALLVVAQSPGVSSFGREATRAGRSGCVDGDVLIVPTGDVASNASVPAGEAAALKFRVTDCNDHSVDSFLTEVSVDFNNTDARAGLTSRGNGNWEGTWTPSNKRAEVSVSPKAIGRNGSTNLRNVDSAFVVKVTPGTRVQPKTIFNAASYQPTGQISPGSWTAIFGDQMADGVQRFEGSPFPKDLQGTQVTLQNMPLPIYYVDTTQINALIPATGLGVNTRNQLQVVRHGDTLSVPLDVTVAALQPGIYTYNQKGTGQGAVLLGNTGTLAGPVSLSNARPARRGDYIQIYCTGLGPVSNTPPDGAPALSSPLSLTQIQPKVTIGGLNAPVVFSGLAPGNVGLYQVNAQVPVNAPTGEAITLSLTVGNVVSNEVTIAIQ